MTRAPTRTSLTSVILVGMALACGRHSTPPAAAVTVQVGIFFGGQVQNRPTWPLVLDETRQTQGFRINFGLPLSEPARVSWDIARPASKPRRRASTSSESPVSSFEVTVPAGTDRLDQVIHFTDTDRPGTWKLHVFVNGASVLDRSIEIVSKSASPQED